MGGPVRFFRRRKETWLSTDKEPESEEHEEIEYEPVSVRELLTEMKDISELIIDLAYSAVAFDAQEIADEVRDLEARIETLNYQVRLQAMMAARSLEDAERMTGILQLAAASDKIADASADIARLVESEVDLRAFMPRLLDAADESLTRLPVLEGSAAVGSTIGEHNIESETGNRVIAVRRGKHWIYGPGRRFELRAGDALICRGRPDGADRLKRWLAGEEDEL